MKLLHSEKIEQDVIKGHEIVVNYRGHHLANYPILKSFHLERVDFLEQEENGEYSIDVRLIGKLLP